MLAAAAAPLPPPSGWRYALVDLPHRPNQVAVDLEVNGEQYTVLVEPRRSLVDCLRDDLGLTGSHVGCEQGVCGACTVLLDGEAVRGCLLLTVQAQGTSITTVEGLAQGGELSPLQSAFHESFALQCGYCTPGFLISSLALLARNPHPSRTEVREALSGNLCRCTGYDTIVDAVMASSR